MLCNVCSSLLCLPKIKKDVCQFWATRILLMILLLLFLLPSRSAAWLGFTFGRIVKSNEYEFHIQFRLQLPLKTFSSIRRILPPSSPFLYIYIYFVFCFLAFIRLFGLCLMSPFWKWYSRVKTLIRLALLKGVAAP